MYKAYHINVFNLFKDKHLVYYWMSQDVIWDIIKDNLDKPWNWYIICKNPNITWDIIKDNPDIPWNWTAKLYFQNYI